MVWSSVFLNRPAKIEAAMGLESIQWITSVKIDSVAEQSVYLALLKCLFFLRPRTGQLGRSSLGMNATFSSRLITTQFMPFAAESSSRLWGSLNTALISFWE